jgi:hypothetical protein
MFLRPEHIRRTLAHREHFGTVQDGVAPWLPDTPSEGSQERIAFIPVFGSQACTD